MYRCRRGSATRFFSWEDITYQLHQSLNMVVFISHEKHNLPQLCGPVYHQCTSFPLSMSQLRKQIFKLSLLINKFQGCISKTYLSNLMKGWLFPELPVIRCLAHWSEPLQTVALLCLSLLVSHPHSTAMLCFRGHLLHKIQKCLHLGLH